MKMPIEWYREMYQKGSGAFAGTADIAAIQADALDELRDRFACAALAGLMTNFSDDDARAVVEHVAEQTRVTCPDVIANYAYNLADAMMARRATQPTTGAPAPTTKGQ